MSRFLVYRSLARYDALGCFADQLVAALRGLGHDAELLVFSGADLVPRLTAALGRRPAALFAFNGLGVELEALNDRLYTRLGLPYVGINVDHPVYLLERLRAPLDRHFATFVDHSHVAFAERFFPGLRPSFLPHAATVPPDPGRETRDLGIIFAGSYEEPGPIAEQWRAFKPATAALFEDTAARCLTAPDVGLYEHFEAAFTARACPPR